MYSNDSNVTFIYPLSSVYETSLTFVLSTLTALSCVSNLYIIVVFIKFKCLRTKHDMLIINLAFINLIVTIGVSFYSTYGLNPGDILRMKQVCLHIFICLIGGKISSLFVLLHLSLERYIYIVYPVFYRQIKHHHVVISSGLGYGIGLLYTVIPYLFGNDWEKYHLCVADVYPFEFSVGEQVFGVLVISLTITMNVIVFKTVLFQASKINILLRKSLRQRRASQIMRRKRKAFVTVFLLSGVSVICWIPLLVVFTFESNPELNKNLKLVLTKLLYIPVTVNASVTAFIIGYRNKHFKDALKSVYCKRKHECS